MQCSSLHLDTKYILYTIVLMKRAVKIPTALLQEFLPTLLISY